MFIDEAKLAAQLSHNHIIQIYDLGKAGEDFFIAMEFVDGKDLRSILDSARKQGKPLPIELALMIVAVMVLVNVDVIGRGAFNLPVSGVPEIVSIMFVRAKTDTAGAVV